MVRHGSAERPSKDAVALCDTFVSQIASIAPTLNRGATKSEGILQQSLIACAPAGEIFLDSGNSKQALNAPTRSNPSNPFCPHAGTSEAAFMRTLSLEGAQLYLLKSATTAELHSWLTRALAFRDALRPLHGFLCPIGHLYCKHQSFMNQPEAVSQALRLSEIITRTPLRSRACLPRQSSRMHSKVHTASKKQLSPLSKPFHGQATPPSHGF